MSNQEIFPDVKYDYHTVGVDDSEMAYIDTGGEGDAIVFLHGNPTSSYLWRNVIPHVEGLGRCLAPDLIGMGKSGKMPSGTYRYLEHARYLEAWMDAVGATRNVILVVHDWGAALGFNWANTHRDRVAGIAYMEAMVQPRQWTDLPEERIPTFKSFRTEEGKRRVLEDNLFVEKLLFEQGIIRTLLDEEKAVYREPYPDPESRLPTWVWPCEIAFDGEPADNHEVIQAYADWLSESDLPKLFINTTEGHALVGRNREFCRTWPNQTEITVEGRHYAQEDCPSDIGKAVAELVVRVRGNGAKE